MDPEHARVLVVDDHAESRIVLCALLENSGFGTAAATLDEAVSAFAADRYQYVLLHLGHPRDPPGLPIAAAIMEADPHVAVIGVTGWPVEAFSRHAVKLRAIVQKPIDIRQLLALMPGARERL